jgi:hypothetical protein
MVPIQELVIALGVSFIPVTGTLATLWLGARRRALKAEKLVHELAIAPALRGERPGMGTAQLGQALDAIAVEVERISEGQRFTTKLLSERREGVVPPAAPPRVITPH